MSLTLPLVKMLPLVKTLSLVKQVQPNVLRPMGSLRDEPFEAAYLLYPPIVHQGTRDRMPNC
jgi:hypothetical protein